ncbi:acyl-CoA dehydrogenase family protein [Nocardioides sp. NPDC004968]|uniref:acyl-CoA dehydrogenase family protein n=1 Tax=Nocardioides sp. NPDC004968 TaxID=3155894 RepID=UPI0033B0360A
MLYDYTLGLREDEIEAINRARDLAPGFAERAAHHDETGEFPHENLARLDAAGLMDVVIPREFGGTGSPELFCGAVPTFVVFEIAKACAGTAWCLLSHYHATGQVAGVATAEQAKEIFGRAVANRERFATIGSEINIQNAQTSTEAALSIDQDTITDDEGLIIRSGFKGFTSTAAFADRIVWWHKDPESMGLAEGLLLSLVPRDRSGWNFLPGWENAIGIRCSASGPAKVENLRIYRDEILGGPGDWTYKHPYTHELLYAALLTGIAAAAYDGTLEAVRGRTELHTDRALMNYIGEMSSAVQAAIAGLRYATEAWKALPSGDAHHITIRALHTAKETAQEATRRSFELVGTRAAMRKAPFDRYRRDSRVASLHTREWQHMEWVARGDLTGERFAKEKYGPAPSAAAVEAGTGR